MTDPTSNQKFHCGRFDAYQHNGRIALEFMAGGDEEQYVDFKPEEAKAFYEWLAKVLAVETSDNPYVVTEYQRGFDDGFKRAIQGVQPLDPRETTPVISETAEISEEAWKSLKPGALQFVRATELFDHYLVGTLFQKKADGRILAMTPDGATLQARAPLEPTEPQSSHVCRWTRLPDLTDPFETHKVRYRCGCNGEVVSGVHPIYPDDCPKCGKQVLPTPKLPEKATERRPLWCCDKCNCYNGPRDTCAHCGAPRLSENGKGDV